MTRIPDYILNCVIYLYPTLEDAKESKNVGGSGFLLGVNSKSGDFVYTYAVTNAHVVNNGCHVIRLNKRDGNLDYIVKTNLDWVRHLDGDDLAATWIRLNDNVHKLDFYVSDNAFADKNKINKIDIGVGDEIFIVGRFQSSEGKNKNTPTLRFGNIAQMPIEPHLLETGLKQEGYLIECHSICGFSGSPVFIVIPPFAHRPKTNEITSIWQRYFLGIDTGHKRFKEEVEFYNEIKQKWEKNRGLRVLSNSAMTVVIPAWKLTELLDQPQLKLFRETNDEKVKKENTKKTK